MSEHGLKSVFHVEEVSRTTETVTYDAYLNNVFWYRETMEWNRLNQVVFSMHRKEREPIGYIQEAYN